MRKHLRKPLTTLFLLVLLTLGLTAGCEKGGLPPDCWEVTFVDNGSWTYEHGVWYGDLGQVVGIANGEMAPIYACKAGLGR